ncbi:acetoacetate--CoA ligase [Microvirgula aerodenitrificans]|uniref:acetoacetate--CoA ligase n=1 Tax=Microvirgula aerodenitrificans TaxID=57480 RepID=UPI00248D443B|nr:acetoacetate--CoA ligase [Microvirgula aerodenitrificans]
MNDTLPIWTPSAERIAASRLTAFTREAEARSGRTFADYPALWQWSIDQRADFWDLLWDFTGVIGSKGEVVLENGEAMPGARWFPQAELNYAENLLRRRDDGPAVVFSGEGHVNRRLSHRELYDAVSRVAQALAADGVGPGDRVGAMLPNLPETLIAMLATASLGAIWASCSPDFGTDGALDRFGQIGPTVWLVPDGYLYNGKAVDVAARVDHIAAQLPDVRRVVVVPYVPAGMPTDARTQRWDDWIAPYAAGDIAFDRGAFDRPLFIMFSSGTTGKPKCIVHGAGGTLLQHLKEHQLHTDVRPGDRLFYFTTCGWMMWNWLMTGLASDATLLLYDGSPFASRGSALWDWFAAEQGTHFGTSAKYLDAAHKTGLKPATSHKLDALRVLMSTGSPLVAEGFDYVYRDIKADLQLASISGGTDIVSCFALGCPTLPVWRGELQCRGLGMAVEITDEQGRTVREEKGELVCRKPFPCMPVGFWNDPDGSKYHAAYFARFPGIWCHGDFAELTAHDGVIIYGRSDAVLNPGGVRIGTAEIYRQVEQIDEVLESLACGQRQDGDERVVLFVRLRDGITLDDALRDRIRQQIRSGASPRHVPARIAQVNDIPRTLSGKIVELAVKNTIHGEPVLNLGALANPEALREFVDRPELAD